MNFHIKKLDKIHIDQAYELHKFVYDYLSKINKKTLSKKHIQDIEYEIVEHITIGVFNSNDKLVGKSTLLINPSENEKEFDVYAPNHTSTGVVRSTCIHPEYQKKGLYKKIMEEILDKNNNNLICSTIMINNFTNLRNRINQGFSLFQISGNKKENINVYCLIHIDRKSLKHKNTKYFHYKDIKNVISILNEGYIGTNISPCGTIKFVNDRKIRKFVGCFNKSTTI